VTYLGVSRTTELCAVIPSVNVCALHNSVPCCQVLACPMRRQCVPGPSTAVHCSTCTLTAKAPAPQLKQVPVVQCHAMWHAVMSSMVLLSRRHLWPCFLCSSVRPKLSLDRSANCVSLLDDACLGVQMVCTMFPKLAASCRCVVLVDSRVCVYMWLWGIVLHFFCIFSPCATLWQWQGPFLQWLMLPRHFKVCVNGAQ
jgi:hypothetical protein